jgi:hypothetical protein
MQVRKLTVIDFTYGVPILSTCSCCARMFRVTEAEAIENPQVARDKLIDTFNDHPCGSSSCFGAQQPLIGINKGIDRAEAVASGNLLYDTQVNIRCSRDASRSFARNLARANATDPFPWALVSNVAATMGDSSRVNAYLVTIQDKYFDNGYPWPWYSMEAGWFSG